MQNTTLTEPSAAKPIPPLPDITTSADIKTLVDSFYDKVNQDALLSPIFNQVAHVNWPHHLPTMYKFWGSMLLDENSYRGQPFLKHVNLPISGPHFERWLSHFFATVDEHFAGPKAEEAKLRAKSIADVFEYKITNRSSFPIVGS